ncbi:MAG: leucine-rich repeat protein, partial [Muribaculaceae bacterium]|nr:leucine-rich repeat protein [Muribaculaceae bacterium]
MIFPTISEYIEAIRYAEDNFATLTSLRPVLDGDGNPVMSSGNFAVVFKMRDEKSGKCHALKCFIKDQDGRSESYRLISDELEYVSNDCFVRIQYKENELYVNTSSSPTTDFPVLLMDWVDGITLDRYVSQHIHDRYALRLICYQFCRMASWLMTQPFAHGDLKPDNILVRSDNSLVLVDYDGMFVTAMSGQQARETGSPDYRHPLRTIDDFNEHIDDFSLAAIAMQLFAVSLAPGLLASHHGDTLLLTAADHHDPAASAAHGRLKPLLTDPVFERLYALYHFAHATQHLDAISFRAFNIPKPTFVPQKEELSTKVTQEDIENGVKDEYGAIYSADGSRLLEVDKGLKHYRIREGTRVICDSAFSWCSSLALIELPSSITYIGNNPFNRCVRLHVENRSPLFETDSDALYTKG